MSANIREIAVSIRDTDHCKRLADPVDKNTFHMEVLLPFSEAAKLDRGNANVRPFSEQKRPFKEMLTTVEEAPGTFHLKNRGITYLCEAFEFDNKNKQLTISIPDIPSAAYDDDDAPLFGIADGGHTFEVILRTISRLEELRGNERWNEPFVRVHLMSGESRQVIVEEIVEALNTSSQVQAYTLDEYQGQFDELKAALKGSGFDTSLVAFRENETAEWHIVEIIQRLACFLRDRWQEIPPTSMYKSRIKALGLYITEQSRTEFRRLYGLINEIVTLPEYIQSQLSQGEGIERMKLGKVRGVKTLKKLESRPGTSFQTKHKLDLAALLPMAAALRELLVLRGDRYQWRLSPYEVFPKCAEQLYKALLNRSSKAKIISHLGTDTEYWGACAQIVMRVQTSLLEEKFSHN
jgi:AIPR protein